MIGLTLFAFSRAQHTTEPAGISEGLDRSDDMRKDSARLPVSDLNLVDEVVDNDQAAPEGAATVTKPRSPGVA